ncbi:NAD synthetase [Pseudomonas vranovensis]|uniref:NAD synthetase n=1 Tax=Pseudomonas vranovensis TaxID=321661 RepID=A0A423DUA5_9PSED|nr:NAD synthetase [Pseudomonas vranovensis]ROL75631.1 NAD synthetase [Pseudomonas vranovensis]
MNDSRMSGLGASPSQYFARQRIESLVNVPRLFAAIDADPGIVGAGVVYIDADYNVMTLREFRPICSVLPKRVVLQEVKRYLTPEQYALELQHNARQARMVEEVANARSACRGAIFGVVAVVTGGLITPFTGPVGATLSAIGATAVLAGVGQCGFGLFRVYSEHHRPERNDWLDEQLWYQFLMPLLDDISLLGAAASLTTVFRSLQVRKIATKNSWFDLGRALSRQQRGALMKEVLSIKHPSLTAKQLKLQQKLGVLPKRYTPTEIRNSTIASIRDSLDAVLNIAGNDTVQSIAFSLVEETEE